MSNKVFSVSCSEELKKIFPTQEKGDSELI
jgi:hypothetical protein